MLEMTLNSYVGSGRAVTQWPAVKFGVCPAARRGSAWILLVAILSLFAASRLNSIAQAPVMNSLKLNGQLTWSHGYNSNTNDLARLEISTNLAISAWTPFFYDFVSTNLPLPFDRLPVFFDPPTNTVRSLMVPTGKPAAFFRTAIQSDIPDTNLVLHLTYNNDFSRGIVLDTSGYGNHGLRYGATNWPSLTVGPDGSSQAGEFHVFPADDPTYFGVGDYMSVLGAPSIDALSQATIMVWAHYYLGTGGDYSSDSRATLLDTDYGDNPGSWSLGRHNDSSTSFFVVTGTNVGYYAVGFPDGTITGDTGGWHLYVVTFDNGLINGYFDAQPCGSFSVVGSIDQLHLGGATGYYLAVGTWAHDGTPQFNDDQYPNCCWMHGAMGDTRIYNRVLSTNEIQSYFLSFDKIPPSVPFNLSTRAAASNQIELRWSKATDNFSVAGYTVRRNGTAVGTATGPSYVDTGIAAGATYNYTVDAFDASGNHSAPSSQITTNTPTTAAVAVLIDDEDGPQRFVNPSDWPFAVVTGSSGNGFHYTNTVGQSVSYLPVLPGPGSYDVYAFYGGLINGAPNYIWADNVPIDIVHNGVTNTVLLDEEQAYGTWVNLGFYNFAATTNEFVRFRTDGTSGHGQGYVGVDAIMFAR